MYYLKVKIDNEWMLLSGVVYDTREEAEAALSRLIRGRSVRPSVLFREMRIHELGDEDLYRRFARDRVSTGWGHRSG